MRSQVRVPAQPKSFPDLITASFRPPVSSSYLLGGIWASKWLPAPQGGPPLSKKKNIFFKNIKMNSFFCLTVVSFRTGTICWPIFHPAGYALHMHGHTFICSAMDRSLVHL